METEKKSKDARKAVLDGLKVLGIAALLLGFCGISGWYMVWLQRDGGASMSDVIWLYKCLTDSPQAVGCGLLTAGNAGLAGMGLVVVATTLLMAVARLGRSSTR
ncbi:MAG: hypothetical protein A2785_02885 [Candidatus Chisholmbacteria bacterium RIFCSPHIGHO2_01_FULL_49_18]|uniref:Uncharacterized protein n=2 Tax=Candidatus Chisholmiibacteriota TaxID=1817900 RepID=A0A1G1VM90_9BACT|nr:MAG: hypothetical protein A2785_02885 [Candidatus Chisholmbacteria bacterium RIFCSPHIGHO2_01_FULL_49_18]OGY21024.1 MAG: hypothetical protein A3A65_01805 [Candidatus Chisholmbacteria bacterium RIFCSPLOWO2_01_FULL_49_14]